MAFIRETWEKRKLRDKYDEIHSEATKLAFNVPYEGDGHLVLKGTIDDMNATRQRSRNHEACAWIINSSGTGKSRTVDELAKKIFTFPFDLTDTNTCYSSGRNEMPRFLVQFGDPECFKIKCLLFFEALFTLALTEIQQLQYSSLDEFSHAWYTEMESQNKPLRGKLYAQAEKEASEQVDQISEPLKETARQEGDPYRRIDFRNEEPPVASRALAAATKLLDEICKRLGIAEQEHSEHSKPVKLLLYFDGAIKLRGHEDFCPYTALVGVLDEFRSLDIFALFLSSSPSVLEVVPKNAQPPITELPFDICWNNRPLISEGEHTLEEMCQQDFMAQFGRPIFSAMNRASDFVHGYLIKIMVDKLRCFYEPSSDQEDSARLAAASIRLHLEPSRADGMARWTEKHLVGDHLRIILSIPRHREYLITGTPSEPILAEAAAQLLYQDGGETNRFGSRFICGLHKWAKKDILKKEDINCYVACALLTAAHDTVIKAMRDRDGTFEKRNFSTPIGVVEFIEALFQPEHASKVLDSQPQGYSRGKKLREAFSDSYIQFTHFRPVAPELLSDAMAFAGICRGMGWTFMHSKDLGLNIGIPIFLGGTKEPVNRFKMSMMFIHVGCAGDAEFPIPNMDSEVNFFTKASDGLDDRRPYIVLNMNLGLRHPFCWDKHRDEDKRRVDTWISLWMPEEDPVSQGNSEQATHVCRGDNDADPPPVHPHYSITATGCTYKVYRVLKSDDTRWCMNLLEMKNPELQTRKGKDSYQRGAFGPEFHEGSFGWVKFINPREEQVWDIDQLEGVTIDY